jgi:hypothetical protein
MHQKPDATRRDPHRARGSLFVVRCTLHGMGLS